MKKKFKRGSFKSKKETSSKLVKIIFVLIILLTISFSIILIIQSSILNPIYNLLKKPKKVVLNDECSLIFNQIVHQIKNSGDCRISCRNECQIRNLNFYDSEFIAESNSCNICDCYCK